MLHGLWPSVFKFEDVENIDSKILYYTGIPDRQTFHAVFDELKDKESVASRESYHSRPRRLRKIDDFFWYR